MAEKKQKVTLEKIVNLAKRRGFVYQSSEIYGGFAAIYDFGPYGVELENAVKREWWKAMVQLREDVVGLDAAIVMHPKVWEASGHVAGFNDPLIECRSCQSRSRADHLLEEKGIYADEKMEVREINKLFDKHREKISCPACGKKTFADIKKYNLLVKSNLGSAEEDWTKDPVYLRGETCQGIYVDYKNVLDSSRVKVPFGIAQIGKAFRNEITARQFIFRTREFEQMEMQYFTTPKQELADYEKLRKERWQYYLDLGVKKENLKWHKHEKLVFYAKEAYDIEYNYPFGFAELEGVHARGNYDLTQHTAFSGKDLSYTDLASGKKFIPHVIESSVGVGRTVLMLLCEAYTEEEVEGETRIVMKFPKKIAPVKVAIFPLLKNKPKLIKKAREIFDELKENLMCEYDDNGNVGKRYRRQDEIGTPYCVTVDFESLEDKKVTVRDRDTMKQERVNIDDLKKYFNEKIA